MASVIRFYKSSLHYGHPFVQFISLSNIAFLISRNVPKPKHLINIERTCSEPTKDDKEIYSRGKILTMTSISIFITSTESFSRFMICWNPFWFPLKSLPCIRLWTYKKRDKETKPLHGYRADVVVTVKRRASTVVKVWNCLRRQSKSAPTKHIAIHELEVSFLSSEPKSLTEQTHKHRCAANTPRVAIALLNLAKGHKGESIPVLACRYLPTYIFSHVFPPIFVTALVNSGNEIWFPSSSVFRFHSFAVDSSDFTVSIAAGRSLAYHVLFIGDYVAKHEKVCCSLNSIISACYPMLVDS